MEDEYWEMVEDSHLDISMTEEVLLSYCQTLTPNQKKYVLYTAINDLSVIEIAQREKVSVSAVKQWRAGARAKLKEKIIIE